MDAFIEAVKGGDLIKAKKAFIAEMAARTAPLIEEARQALAKSILIEGEEPKDEDDEHDDAEDKGDKKPESSEDDADDKDDKDDK